MLERVDTGRRDDPGLSHGTAEQVLLAPRPLDRLRRAREQRTERAAQTLREAERDGVEQPADLGCRDPGRDRGVQEPRAVEVGAHPALAGGGRDRLQVGERPAATARGVVRVLDGEHGRPLVGGLRARDGDGLELVDAEPPSPSLDRLDHQPGVRRRPAVLVDHDVRVALRDEDVARARVQLQRDLVRERRGRQEQRRLVPEQGRGALLQRVDGRVLPALLVADVRRGDRGPHAGGRTGGRVGPEVDHGRTLSRLGQPASLRGTSRRRRLRGSRPRTRRCSSPPPPRCSPPPSARSTQRRGFAPSRRGSPTASSSWHGGRRARP